jgi:hypothetical protein
MKADQGSALVPQAGMGVDVPGPAASAAADFLWQVKAPNTVRAYRARWQHFCAWCQRHGVPFLPATGQTVAMYLSCLGSSMRCSMRRRL